MLGKCGGDIYQSLVGAAPEEQGEVAKTLNKRAVDQHVHLFKQGSSEWIDKQLLDAIACIAPYGMGGLTVDFPSQQGECHGLEHWVATRESHIQIFHQYLLGDSHDAPLVATSRVPRLGIVATGAMVDASGAIDGSAQPRAIDRGAVDDVQQTNIICVRCGH